MTLRLRATNAIIDASALASSTTSGEVLTSNGTGKRVTWQAAAGGGPIQHIYTQSGAFQALGSSTSIPVDNTIPQVTEGVELTAMAKSITPTIVGNTIRVKAKAHLSSGTATIQHVLALFDGISNPDAVTSTAHANDVSQAERMYALTIDYEEVVADLTQRNFTVRAGNTVGAAAAFNGRNAGRVHGGVLNSFIRIEEWLP